MRARLTCGLWIVLYLLVVDVAIAERAFVRDGVLQTTDDDGVIRAVEMEVTPIAAFDTAGDVTLVGVEAYDALPSSDQWGGMNLYAVDGDGEARQLAFGRRVLTASSSEATDAVAYGTRNARIFLTDLEGFQTTRIIDRGLAPAISPDGAKIAYARPTDDWRAGSLAGGFDLHVYDIDSGESRALTTGFDDSQPVWSPEGETIYFLSGRRTGVTSIWSVPAGGGDAVQATNHGLDTAADDSFVPNYSRNGDVSWSPDGSALLYGARYSEAGEVVVLELDGDRLARAKILGAGLHPTWSDDGEVRVPGPADRKGTLRWVAPGLTADDVETIEIDAGRTDARMGESGGTEALAVVTKSSSCSAERFRWPVATHPTSPYYYYDNNNSSGAYRNWKCSTTSESYDQHRGTDIPVGCGTAVFSGAAGNVSTRNDGCPDYGALGNTCGLGFGNYVKIDHGNSWFSVYAHLKNGTARALGAVGCGVQIGQSCSSGNSTGAHLHFEVQKYAAPGNDPYSGSCSGTESFWCNQNGAGTGKPTTTCCCN